MSQCPQCGTATTEGQPFCGACGATLAAQTPAPDPDEGKTQIRDQRPPQNQTGEQQWGQQPAAPQQPAPQAPPQQQTGQQQWGQQAAAPQQPHSGQQQWGQPQPPPGQYAAPGQQGYGAPGQPAYGAPGQPAYGAPGQQGAPQGQYGAPQGGGNGINFDFSKLLIGNWAGMAMVAGSALGVAFLFGLIFAFTTAEDLSVGSAIWTTLAQTAAAFGANSIVDAGGSFGADEVGYSVGQYPLLATILAFTVAGRLYQRATASYTDIKVALIDAVRAGLILAVAVTIIAIVVSIVSPEVKGYESLESTADSGGVFGLFVLDGDTKVSIAGAIFLPLILMSVILALVAFARRDWLTGKAALVHEWVAAPLRGLLVLIAGLFVLGLVFLVCQIIGEEDGRSFAAIMRGLAVLPSMGVLLTSLGVFGEIGSTTDSDVGGKDDSDTDWDRIAGYADDHGAVFWIAPIAAIALAAGVLWYIHTITPDKSKLLRNFGVYLGSLIVLVPIIVRFANAHVGADIEFGDEDGSISSTLGAEGFQTMFFFLLLSLIAAVVILLVTGNLDVNALKAKAQSFQGQPGHGTGPQHPQGGQQWGQPGTGPQQPQGGQQWGQPQQPPQQGGQQWGQQPPVQQPPQQGGQPQPPQQGQQPPYGQQPPQQGGWQPPTQ